MMMMITVKQLSLLGMGRDSNQTMSSHPSIINIESLHLTFFMSMMMMMTAGEITGITMALMLTHGAWASCSFLSALQSVVFFTNSMLWWVYWCYDIWTSVSLILPIVWVGIGKESDHVFTMNEILGSTDSMIKSCLVYNYNVHEIQLVINYPKPPSLWK